MFKIKKIINNCIKNLRLYNRAIVNIQEFHICMERSKIRIYVGIDNTSNHESVGTAKFRTSSCK